MEEYELINNEESKQYEFHIGKYIPKIDYTISQNNLIYLTHTEVPVALEGQGIGSQLLSKVFADIEKKGLQVVPLCSFITGYIKKHPEWSHIVAKDINV